MALVLEDNDDINIKGYITGIRSAPKPIEENIKEVLHNSLEVIRLAEKKYSPSDINSEINITMTINNNKLKQIEFDDKSTKGTGIQELKEKGLLKMYHHKGENTGFSEYGEGGSQSIKQMADGILYETINYSQVSESLSLNINKAIKLNSFKKAAEYSDRGSYKLDNGFTTGTKITLTDLVESYQSERISRICLDGSLAKSLSSYLIDINLNIKERIHLIIIKDSDVFAKHIINPVNKLLQWGKDRTTGTYLDHQLHIYQENNTKEIVCTFNGIHGKNKSEQLLTFSDLKKTTPKSFNTHKYTKISDCKLHLFTDENRNINLMGFDGWRKVEGNNIVKTNSEPLKIGWTKWNSHRTRYAQFRGAIEYDRHSDKFFRSDSSKTITDDRPFEESIRLVIIGLTDQYFKKMKATFGHYDTEDSKKKGAEVDEHDDDESANQDESTQEQEIVQVSKPDQTPVNVLDTHEIGSSVVVNGPEIKPVSQPEQTPVNVLDTHEIGSSVVVNGPEIKPVSQPDQTPVNVLDTHEIGSSVVVNGPEIKPVSQTELKDSICIKKHDVVGSIHTSINFNIGLQMLKKINEHFLKKRDESLYDSIIKQFQDCCSPTQSEKYLRFMNYQSKYDMIIMLINEKYEVDTNSNLKCGSEIAAHFNELKYIIN